MSLPIQIVNDADEPVGQSTKQEAWERGLIHRIVRVMLMAPDGRLLLQHRSPTKDIFPDRWDNSVAGHVDAGESYDEAARREASEELGLVDLELEGIGSYRSDETWEGHRFNRFTRVYQGRLAAIPTRLEVGKVDGVAWYSVDEARRMVREQPDRVTDGLRQVMERYF